MRRRAFIGGLGGAAAWSLVTRAQQPAMPVIGYLSSGTAEQYAAYWAAIPRSGSTRTPRRRHRPT